MRAHGKERMNRKEPHKREFSGYPGKTESKENCEMFAHARQPAPLGPFPVENMNESDCAASKPQCSGQCENGRRRSIAERKCERRNNGEVEDLKCVRELHL